MNDIREWMEPQTGAVSCDHKPGDYSCHNGILFSAMALKLGLIYIAEFIMIHARYVSVETWFLRRYPKLNEYMSYDDHLASVVAIEAPMWKGWTTPDGKFLGRFPLFVAVVHPLAFGWLASLQILLNCFQARKHTSGKQLIWLAQHRLKPYCRFAYWIWRKAMMRKYPGGLREMLAIYYNGKPTHPIVEAAPNHFDISKSI